MTISTHRGRIVIDLRHTWPSGRRERIRIRVPDDQQAPRKAAAFERTILAQLRAGIDPRKEEKPDDEQPKEAPTLEEMWPRFIAHQASSANKKPNRPRTIREAQRMFDAHLCPALGRVRVDRITEGEIDDFVERLEAGAEGRRPLKHNSIANVLGLLRRMLHVARRWHFVEKVPEINVEKRKAERIEDDQWLTEDEVSALVESTEPAWRPILLLGARAGLRCGELQGVRWCDFDLDAGRLTVARSWSDHTTTVGPPKSGKRREVPLTWDVVQAIESIGGKRTRDAYVFGKGERPFRQDELRRALARARKGAAIEKHVHVHMLRHTFASHCIMRGIASRIVMAWGGWASEAMLARYAHLAPRQVEDLINRIAPSGGPLRVVARGQGVDRMWTTGGYGLGTLKGGRSKTAP